MDTCTSTLPRRTPSPEYIASRVHSIANYKLRLEASQNEPRLRKLLGHIFVYDAIREHQQSQASVYTSPPAQRRREQQPRRRQMSETSRLAHTTTHDDATNTSNSDNAADIKAYLATLPTPPTVPQSQVHDFAVFQRAIAAQLATLSQVRLEAASRQLYYMTQDDDDADEQAVDEYAESDDDDSDYDSYDGDDGDWRHDSDFAFDWQPTNSSENDEHDGDGDSDTDPDSVNSAPPSPLSEESPVSSSSFHDAKGAGIESKHKPHQGLTQTTGTCYFLPLRPVPRRRQSDAAPEGFRLQQTGERLQ